MTMNSVRDAQIMDCASFYKKHEKRIEMDEVENINNLNEGMVNLIYHGIDGSIAILFCNSEYIDWSYNC